MKNFALAALTFACSISLHAADEIARRVADDAKVIRRIAEVSRRDFPEELVGRIIEEDLELLRGKRADGTYAYARYEREEGGRESDRFAIRGRNESQLDTASFSTLSVHRVIVSVPNRRLLVARNRRVFVDRVDIDYTPFEGRRDTKQWDVRSWIDVGESKSFDLPEISKRAKVTVHAHVDGADGGPATIEIAAIAPRLVDNADSPYAEAVRAIKSLGGAAKKRELAQVKSGSARLLTALGDAASPAVDAVPSIPVIATDSRERPSSMLESMPQIEIYLELQRIEDLLTGSESERRDGLDALHQLIRRLRVR